MKINLRRWPLLFPLVAAVVGLSLIRTDLFAISVSLVVLIVLFSGLLWLRQRLLALLLLLGVLWGVGDLVLDASRVAVDRVWLTGEMVVTADIEKVERQSAGRRFLLSHVSREDGLTLAGNVLFYQYRYAFKQGDVPIVAGQRIRIKVRWRLPRNYHNPGSFDYRAWCFDRQIALIGSARGSLDVVESNVSWLQVQRQKVRIAIANAAGPENDHGILPALLLAERSQIDQRANRIFSATGTAHLLAISGMHIGMAAGWVFALVWFLLTRREAWMVHLPVRNLAMLSGFLAALAYGTMAGWPLPAIRATVMLGAAALAWCLSTRSEPMNSLLAALALILLFDPSAIASLSLWLSFVATASLLLWVGRVELQEPVVWQQRMSNATLSLLWVSLLATLATLPLVVASFGRIPVYSLPANMIMVPLYGCVVMPAALLGELAGIFSLNTLAAGLFSIANMGVDMGLKFLSMLMSLPAGEVWSVRPSMALNVLYVISMLFAGWLLWSKQKMRALCLGSVALTIYIIGSLHESTVLEPQWIVWDVGQGASSTLLLPQNKVIVVDVPGRAGSRFNGGTTVAAGLRSLGMSHIDLLILSHAQSDHLGGALSLMRSVNSVGQIWLPDVPHAHADKRVKAIERYAAKQQIPIHWMAKGDVETWKGASDWQVSFRLLWPPRLFDVSNANNTSLVLLAELKNQHVDHRISILWPGDIEKAAERGLLNTGLESVDIMLMPHHGSRSSSHEQFVKRLKPGLVVAQVGKDNRYGFPDNRVVQRYLNHGADVRNTADGAFLLRWLDMNKGADFLPWSANIELRREIAQRWWRSL